MLEFFWDAVSSVVAPLFYALLDLSCTAVLLGLVVLLLRRVFDKKISPLWKNVLWLLVIFALVMPNFVETQASIRMDAPFTTGFEHRNQQQWELESTYNTYLYDVPDDERVSPTDAEEAEALSQVRIFWDGILPLFWLLGMVVMIGILLATRQKMLKNMRAATQGSPDTQLASDTVGATRCGRPSEMETLLSECKRQLNITQSVEIVEQSYLKSPALWGLFHPKILLPDYVAEMSEDSQKYILLHELCHLKCLDLWKNTLLLALQIVYWFNPLVWVLFRFIRQDMELLNDERVLNILQKSEETPYAMSLIEVLGHSNRLPLAPQMLCMVDNKENTKRRIEMIQLGEVFKKHKIIIAVGCLVVIGVLSALFLTSQASPLHWAHTLDKDDIEKVELYWMETGEEDAPYLLDENQIATLSILLNNCNEDEGDDTSKLPDTKALFRVCLDDGTVETVFFHPSEGDTCYFRVGDVSFWGDNYQMNDWMGLINSIRYDQAPPTSNEPIKKVINTQMVDVTNDELSDAIVTSISVSPEDADKDLQTLLNSGYLCDITVANLLSSQSEPAYQKSYAVAHTGNGQLSLVEQDGVYYLLEGSLYTGQGYYDFQHSVFSCGGRRVKSEAHVSGKLDDADASRVIADYQNDLNQWLDDAVAIAILDVGLEEQIISTDEQTFSSKDYYDAKFDEFLGNLEPEALVGDPRRLTADELAYFNEDYFTSDPSRSDINMANQFLHNPFDLPINIDLHSLFYLGAGADYAMSEDGEYDAVAQAYGFDSWAEIPTDVTPIPKASMDYILEQYTGIDLFASKKIGLENFKYLEEYDCYYNLHGDTNYYGAVVFVWGLQMGDRVSLSYYNSWQDADYILTLVDYGGENYKIFSNLPVIIEE